MGGLFLPDDDVFRVVDVVFQGENGVHLVVVQQAEHLLRPGGNDFQMDAGMLLEKLLKILLQKRIAQRIGHGHPNPDGPSASGVHILLQLLGHLLNLLGVGQHLPALVGEHHRAVDALEQREFQFLLQLTNLKGNGGLRAAQSRPGLGKAAQLSHMNKGGQVLQIHGIVSRRVFYFRFLV